MPLVLSAILGLSWIRALRQPFFVSIFGMVVVAAIVVTGQILDRAPLMPDVQGVVSIWLSLLPEMLGIMIPVAALFASVTAAHRWTHGGEMCA